MTPPAEPSRADDEFVADEYRKVENESSESKTTSSESVETRDRSSGRLEKRIVESDTYERRTRQREIYEAGPLRREQETVIDQPQPLTPPLPARPPRVDWSREVPQRLKLLLRGCQAADDQAAEDDEASDLDGDYLLDLRLQDDRGCVWEIGFPAVCGFYRVGVRCVGRADGRFQWSAAFEGWEPGPEWEVVTETPGLRDARLAESAARSRNPSGGVRWPAEVPLQGWNTAFPFPTGGRAAPRSGLSPFANTMFSLGSSSSGGGSSSSSSSSCTCDLTGIELLPAAVAVGEELTARAQGTGLECITWSAPDGDPTHGCGPTFTTKWSTSGRGKSISATCGTETITRTVDVVRLARLEYQDPVSGWQPCPELLRVIKDTSVLLRAVGDPDVEFAPRWSQGSSTSGRTNLILCNQGSGENAVPIRVTCEYGNRIQIRIMVHEVLASLIPEDSFDGRSYSRFGIGERVDLDWFAMPPASAQELGGLRWMLSQGVGAIQLGSSPDDGTATFLAGYEETGIDVRTRLLLKVQSGPSNAHIAAQVDITIVKPNDGRVEQLEGTQIKHTFDVASCGFAGLLYILPADVSFRGVQFREGACPGIATGVMPAITHPAWEQWQGVSGGDIQKGSVVDWTNNRFDHIDYEDGVTAIPGYGTLIWDIPWMYRRPSASMEDTGTQFTTIRHKAVKTAAGIVTISKGEAGPFTSQKDDPTTLAWPSQGW